MARLARFVIPGIPHHVTQRGNGRQQAFLCDDDYALYRDLLRAHAAASGVAVWSWVLMPNHVHLILVPETEDSLRACLSKVHRAYAGHIHAREKRTGLRCFIDPPDQWRARSGKGALAVGRWWGAAARPPRARFRRACVMIRWGGFMKAAAPAAASRASCMMAMR